MLLPYYLISVVHLSTSDIFLPVCQELKHENIVSLLDFQVCRKLNVSVIFFEVFKSEKMRKDDAQFYDVRMLD